MASTRKRLEALTAGLTLPDVRPSPAVDPSTPRMEDTPSAAAAVETRFPPAVTGASAARTGPGQMLAFRGQIQQAEGEMAALREKLRQYDGSLPTLKLDPAKIRPSRWANRHEASFSNSDFAGLKADIEHAGGNVQAILVRPLKDTPGHYELVFGHRRHRATLELGIPVTAAIWVDELGDAALFAAMDRENRERADLSNYEQGVMYQRALDEALFSSQRQLAESLGVSHTWVRKALMVAQLPSPIVECFRSPLEITHRHAEQINGALDKDRRGVLKRVERIRGLNLPAAQVMARLLDSKVPFDQSTRLDVLIGTQKVGSLRRGKNGEVTITLGEHAAVVGDADLPKLGDAITHALRQARTS